MTNITTIGLDLAKSVVQIHGADHDGNPALRKKLRRGQVLDFFSRLPPCLIGMEACSSAHHWAHELGITVIVVRTSPHRRQDFRCHLLLQRLPRVPSLEFLNHQVGQPCDLVADGSADVRAVDDIR